MKVAVLFARRDSNYKAIDGCDVFDADRDARTFGGGMPVVAHPPCRAWGRFRNLARPAEGEKALAPWAVDVVRGNGGVLEHPEKSSLWSHCGLPRPGAGLDAHGGWTLGVDQNWWGHRAKKATWLYIVGLSFRDAPAMPMRLEYPTHSVTPYNRNGHRRLLDLPKAEREHTPPEFARWLVELAARCRT